METPDTSTPSSPNRSAAGVRFAADTPHPEPTMVAANGLEFAVAEMGDPSGPPLMLILGFTAQLVSWEMDYLQRIADGGIRLVLMENRDAGLSSRLDGVDANLDQVLGAALAGDQVPQPAYTLSDMAADVVGVMGALDIDSAHIVGQSMGGMIAQTIAIEHADRVRSLTSVMSTTGESTVGRPTPEAQAALLAPPPTSLEAAIEGSLAWARVCGSKRFFDPETIERRVTREYLRGQYAEGAGRQLAAILGSGDRADGLRGVEAPTLVLHGLDDTLITPDGGRRTAELVQGSTLVEVADMGHDLPYPLWDEIVGSIHHHIDRAESAR